MESTPLRKEKYIQPKVYLLLNYTMMQLQLLQLILKNW
jgi:hypothetical protein